MKDKKTPEKRSLKSFFKSRLVKRGAMSVLITALVIAAIILVNVIVSNIATGTNLSIDVTENSSYKLRDTTTEYISEVKKPVNIYVLQKEADFESGDSENYKYYVQANKLLHAIADSSDNITLRYIDITSNPTFISDYPEVDWTKSHIILVSSGELYRAVDLTDLFTFDQAQLYYGYYVISGQKVEQAIMTAVMNVITEDKTKVMVLSGQAESDMKAFTTLLENNAYEVETVSLLNNEIPDGTEFVVIYVPDVDISDEIYEKLSKWLNNNGEYGRNLVYFPSDQHAVKEYKNINALLEEYGMALRDGYLYENSSDHLIPNYNHYLSIFNYPDSDDTYTKNLRNPSIPVVMNMTIPVDITDSNIASPLLLSSDKSFFIPRDPEEGYTPEAEAFNGAAIGSLSKDSDETKTSTVTVVGSYDAVNSSLLGSTSYNNPAYFINLFNTLAKRTDVSIVIEGNSPSNTKLGAVSDSDVAFPSALVRFIIPIAVVLIGLILWIVRRKKNG